MLNSSLHDWRGTRLLHATDELEGAGHHRVELLFQLPALEAQLDAQLWAKVWTAHGPGLAIRPFSTMPLRADIRDGVNGSSGDTRPEQRQLATALVFKGEADVPIRLVTLLYPLHDRQAAVPAVMPFWDEQDRLSGLTVGDPPATILCSEHSVTVEAA